MDVVVMVIVSLLLSWCEQMVTEAKDKRQEVPHFNASVS